MPQEFRILRCYSCEIFQVDIVKKTTKWICKLCGEKQSVKKIYGSGSAKDCRLHVQQLNTPNGENDGNLLESHDKIVEEGEQIRVNESPHSKRGKWLEFLDNQSSEQAIETDLNEVKGENAKKQDGNDTNDNIFEHTGDLDLSLEF